MAQTIKTNDKVVVKIDWNLGGSCDYSLFDCTTDNVGLHLKNIFASGELVKDSVTEKISATASDGKNYLTQFQSDICRGRARA